MKFDFLKNYIPENYNGENYILPLRSMEGKLNRIAAIPGNIEKYKDTIALKECSYFQEVIATFLCKKETIRLMNIPPGGLIKTHIDHESGYEDGFFRIHIPVITNEKVHFILNDHIIIMKSGEAWYTNVNFPHSVANNGQTNRVHLVIDCIRNRWSDELFQSVGYDFTQEKKIEKVYSKSEVLRIIEELELQDTTETRTFLEQFKREQGIKE
ncbi:aspartyl/asparaginyl beta-hydroxylase domain-containing protein [Lacinutrix sp. WUR7]|uniref:aspartyl/asparaginyl beta-hydroxylase domain-containing protein n=1 Tax=Lacinutrix sp. WUR7 TaxID=2653681 RepID=UPI00193D4BE9|nr:aspartyl/asparaginyl beta-hydroxylase domain-containing protein [Lacinutrix sp. WUR7]